MAAAIHLAMRCMNMYLIIVIIIQQSSHCICETCVWLTVCIVIAYMAAQNYNLCLRVCPCACSYVCLCVCMSSSMRVNECSRIGEPCRMKGRLIKNASAVTPSTERTFITKSLKSYTDTHTERYKCYPVH